MSALSGIKISTPTKKDKVPSTGESVELTPFRVGDEKVLLLASESKDNIEILNAIKNVITNCVKGVDVETLASFDIEYLFIKLRAISVGETAKIGLSCKECQASNQISVDLSKVKVDKPKNHKPLIKISDTLGFEMKYPDLEIAVDMSNDVESIMKVITNSVKTVYWGDEVIVITEDEIEDLEDILNQLTSNQFREIQEFFLTMPKLKEDIDFECSECEAKNEVVLEGMQSFF